MAKTIRVTIALPLANEMIEAIRAVSDRLRVTALSRSERHVYRDGRFGALTRLAERRRRAGRIDSAKPLSIVCERSLL